MFDRILEQISSDCVAFRRNPAHHGVYMLLKLMHRTGAAVGHCVFTEKSHTTTDLTNVRQSAHVLRLKDGVEGTFTSCRAGVV